jgi:hypothetical protein
MAWSTKQKKSIDCNNPKGFSQKAHCAGRKKRQRGEKTKSKSVSEMKKRKKQPTNEVFGAVDKFVGKFFAGLEKGAADRIIKQAEKKKLPPDAIEAMERIKKDRERLRKSLSN